MTPFKFLARNFLRGAAFFFIAGFFMRELHRFAPWRIRLRYGQPTRQFARTRHFGYGFGRGPSIIGMACRSKGEPKGIRSTSPGYASILRGRFREAHDAGTGRKPANPQSADGRNSTSPEAPNHMEQRLTLPLSDLGFIRLRQVIGDRLLSA